MEQNFTFYALHHYDLKAYGIEWGNINQVARVIGAVEISSAQEALAKVRKFTNCVVRMMTVTDTTSGDRAVFTINYDGVGEPEKPQPEITRIF